MGWMLSALFGLISLVPVSAVAFGTMLGVDAIFHRFFPTYHVNQFHAFHQPIVIGVLLAAAVLWILPPHPWDQGFDSNPTARRQPPVRG